MKSNTDIKLNADSGNILLEDNSTQYGALTNNSGNLIIKSGSTTAATFTGANVSLAGTTASSGFVGPLTGTASLATTATAATTATVTDNENADEENL